MEGWAAIAKSCGLNNNQIERMRSAFEHPERMRWPTSPQAGNGFNVATAGGSPWAGASTILYGLTRTDAPR